MKVQCNQCRKRFRVDTEKRPTDVVLCPDCGNPVKTGKTEVRYPRSAALTTAAWLLVPALAAFGLSALREATHDITNPYQPSQRELVVYSVAAVLSLVGFCLSLVKSVSATPLRGRALLLAVVHLGLLAWWSVHFSGF